MKLMGFSAVKFVGPDNFPVWLKVTTKSLEAVLERMENGECIQDKYFADLLDTDTFEKRYALLDKPEYIRRALLDTIDGDTLVEGLSILLLDYNSVQKIMVGPEVSPCVTSTDEDAEEEVEEEEGAADAPEEDAEDESDDEETEDDADEDDEEAEDDADDTEEVAEEEDEEICCTNCGKVIHGQGFEWFGMNYCSPECLTEHEVGAV